MLQPPGGGHGGQDALQLGLRHQGIGIVEGQARAHGAGGVGHDAQHRAAGDGALDGSDGHTGGHGHQQGLDRAGGQRGAELRQHTGQQALAGVRLLR